MSELTGERQVILVSSRSHMEIMGKDIEKDDIITIAWHMPVSFDPQLYAVSIGKTRYSCGLIQKSKSFVVNFVSPDLKDQAIFCGTHSGDHIDKFKDSGLTIEEASSIDCGRIKEALGYLECEVINEVDAGDHIIFLGKVISSDLKKTGKRLFQGTKKDFTTTEY
ncbi:MAG: flavin reductase family protein [Nanoarchaeota archaeon]